MRTSIFRTGLPIAGLFVAGVLAGCSSVTGVTRERVAQSESSLQQAQQAVGRSEAGALELQRAKDNLSQAQAAMAKGDGPTAERFAQLSRLDSELALSKSQSAMARRAADELQASIQTLRQEITRGGAASPAQN